MLARLRKTRQDNEGGFTLIELLVVMIIIGILAAIAIPVFLNQRKKAVDSAAKADVSTIGKEVATYYVDNTVAPTLGLTAATTPPTPLHYTLNSNDIGKQSDKMGKPTLSATPTPTAWCVTLPITSDGSLTAVYYSAASGLSLTGC